MKPNKPTLYRYLSELEEKDILIHQWELTKDKKTPRATKRYKIKPKAKNFLLKFG
ncbi:MAG: hypothetical protein WBH31_02970 [Promethearchaeia archaeon]